MYISVSRGRGPDATAVIVRADGAGKLEALSLDNIGHAKAAIPDAPAAGAKDSRGRDLRVESITDIEFVDGQVIVAGLSNEEFSSKLRSIAYPFAKVDAGTSVEIYHGNHGRYETNSPVRTFVSYTIDGKPSLLAAYTCTPLVKFQLSELKPGNKVMGTTIAELGNMNRPLDMIVYKKGVERPYPDEQLGPRCHEDEHAGHREVRGDHRPSESDGGSALRDADRSQGRAAARSLG